MKAFKITDCFLQVIFASTGLAWGLSRTNDAPIGFLFPLGSNVISAIIHLLLKYPAPRRSLRDIYRRYMTVILSIGMGLILITALFEFFVLPSYHSVGMFFYELLAVYLYLMAFIIPITAILYIKLSIDETRQLLNLPGHEK